MRIDMADHDSRDTRLSSCLTGWNITELPRQPLLIGVLKGKAIGPEVIDATLTVLETIESVIDYRFELRYGDKNGTQALAQQLARALAEQLLSSAQDTTVLSLRTARIQN
jgi:isocitrate/isopropylmalate dehydrogenase